MTEYFEVKNWEQFQHYKDRNPPWIKLHFSMLASEDWVMLDDASRVLAIACMLIASRNDGKVPNNPAYIKRVAYLNKAPNFKPLLECGFLIKALAIERDLQADASASLAGASTLQADARPEAEQSREETEAEQKRATAPPFQKIFDAGIEIFPNLAPAQTSVVHTWLKAGVDPDLDVIPEMKRIKAKGTRVNSWDYLTGPVMDAHATRTKPLPPGNPRSGKQAIKPQLSAGAA